MKASEAFPSAYLKPEDYAEGPETLTIKDVKQEVIGQGVKAEKKMVMYFIEESRKLALNKTNWNSCVAICKNEDSDFWGGKKITLYTTPVQFGSEIIPGIRITDPNPGGVPVAGAGKTEAVPTAANTSNPDARAFDDTKDEMARLSSQAYGDEFREMLKGHHLNGTAMRNLTQVRALEIVEELKKVIKVAKDTEEANPLDDID